MTDRDPTSELLLGLLHHEGAAGSGVYNSYDRWSATLTAGGSVSSPGARLVTVHEAIHVVLNDTTSYGMLLAATAALGRCQDRAAAEALPRLVGYARGLHEAFATYESVWLAVDGDRSFLRGYPRYERWYADAADLVPGPDHLRRKELMIEAAARACMQAPVLTGLGPGRPDWPGVWAVPAQHRPDHRFGLLHRTADAAFWAAAWEDCRAAVDDAEFWRAVERADREPGLRAATYVDAFSESLAGCAHVLYAHVAELLGNLGATTLTYDGHRDHNSDVVRAVEGTVPAAAGLLIASDDSRTAQEESFEMWRRERLVVREKPRPVVVHRFADLLRERRIAAVLSGAGESMHVFGAVRPAFRLVEQFHFADADRQRFERLGSAPVLTLRSEDQAGRLEVTLVESPAELTGLAGALPGRVEAHVNVSLSCLGNIAWRDRFAGALGRTHVTGLMDLSAMAQFDLWRRDGSSLEYAQATVADGEGHPAELLVCVLDDSDLPLLIVCTAVTGDVLKEYLERTYPGAAANPAVIMERQRNIELAVSHLLNEEYYFDMAAYE